MSVVDEYLSTLSGTQKDVLEHMYGVVREMAPFASEELSYAMPAFKYKDKSLIAIMVTKKYMSIYPFCSIERLGLDFSDFEVTKGSIHFVVDKPVPDELLRRIIIARKELIDVDEQ